MKDIQILWAAVRYHCRRIKRFWCGTKILHTDDDWYFEGKYQRVLYWRAYRRWQQKRLERSLCNVGTDLFEEDTRIKGA